MSSQPLQPPIVLAKSMWPDVCPGATEQFMNEAAPKHCDVVTLLKALESGKAGRTASATATPFVSSQPPCMEFGTNKVPAPLQGRKDSSQTSNRGLGTQNESSPGMKLPFRTAFQIQTDTPEKVEWLVKPFVVAGAITEVDGKVKLSGKTTWITHLCRKVLDGEPFMGEPTIKSPVVYLTEQPPSSWRIALERAGLLGREDFHCLYFKDTRGIPWEAVVDEAIAHCIRVGSRLLIVDTLGQFAGIAGDSENNSGDAMQAMAPLQYAAGCGISVIVSRHDRKSGGAVGESARGSSAYTGVVDIVLDIQRPEGNTKKTLRSIKSVGRFDETPEELMIELTEEGYVSLGSATNVAETEAEQTMIAAAPRTVEEAVTVEELIKGSAVSRTTAHRVIKSLCTEGKILSIGEGRKGKPFKYYLPESTVTI